MNMDFLIYFLVSLFVIFWGFPIFLLGYIFYHHISGFTFFFVISLIFIIIGIYTYWRSIVAYIQNNFLQLLKTYILIAPIWFEIFIFSATVILFSKLKVQLQNFHDFLSMQSLNQFYISSVNETNTPGNFIIQNPTVFLSIIGGIALFLYFYYLITIKAKRIAEYKTEESKTLIIFFTALIIIYLIGLALLKPSSPVEADFIGFFILLLFLTYGINISTKQITKNFNSLQECSKIKNNLLRYINALALGILWMNGLILIILFTFFGIAYGFNILNILFVITLQLLLLWAIFLSKTIPDTIFSIHLIDNSRIFSGFVLSETDEYLFILHCDDKITKVMKSSVSYISKQ